MEEALKQDLVEWLFYPRRFCLLVYLYIYLFVCVCNGVSL